MRPAFYESMLLIERAHRYFLEVVKVEMDRLGYHEINNVQALILYNMGEEDVTVGELTMRGYYLGSNVSYNLKKMIETGYVQASRSARDKRSVRVRLTDKGHGLRASLTSFFDRQVVTLDRLGIGEEAFQQIGTNMRKLEGFWSASLSNASFLGSIDQINADVLPGDDPQVK